MHSEKNCVRKKVGGGGREEGKEREIGKEGRREGEREPFSSQ